MNNNNNKNKFAKYLLALIGLTLVSYYIWFRFIRERLPRDIPFQQSYITFIILFMICLVYIYIIIRRLKPITPSKFILNLLIKMQQMYKPFLILDEMLQNNFIFCFFIDRLLSVFSFLIEKYNYYIFQLKNKDEFYFIVVIIPKMILSLIFCIDIFYFHQIKYFYYFIWINLIPVFIKYIFYITEQHTGKKIQHLNLNFYTIPLKNNNNKEGADEGYLFSLDNVLDIEGFMNTKLFIELQASSLTLLCDLYNYDCVETINARENYAKKFNINLCPIYIAGPRNDEISIELSKEYFKWMPIVINISAFLKEHNLFNKERKNKLDKITIITLIIYLICWLYIFFTTLCTLNQESWLNILEVLEEILKNIEEPFSSIKIEKTIDNYE